MLKFPDNLVDKNGTPINEDDLISDGVHEYKIYFNNGIWHDGSIHPEQVNVEAFSCTNGYLHNIDNEVLKSFEKVGVYSGSD